MEYFISDMHLGDSYQLRIQKRPFNSVEEMDRYIIDEWNKKVHSYDDVWIIGDMISHSKKPFSWYLRQLNGYKHLIIGNHDYHLVQDEKARGYFKSINNYKAFHLKNGKMVVLNHYPLAEWNGYYKNVYHIYGHIHSQKSASAIYMAGLEFALSADIVINNYQPASFDELVENNKKYKLEML